MSGKVRACNACQRNGRLTCRRYSDKLRVEDVFFFYCPAVFKTSDVAAVSGLGWGSPVWRHTLWSVCIFCGGRGLPFRLDAPSRRASGWLSWRLWCGCWRNMSVTLWKPWEGTFIRWWVQNWSSVSVLMKTGDYDNVNWYNGPNSNFLVFLSSTSPGLRRLCQSWFSSKMRHFMPSTTLRSGCSRSMWKETWWEFRVCIIS